MKTDVYSWRLSPARKAALEELARAERVSVAELLNRATDELIRNRLADPDSDEREQARLRRSAMRFVGTFRGGDPNRSREARERLRAKLTRRRVG
jgi:hypothetical protein